MMNIFHKFKIDISTYLLVLIYFLCGYLKNIIFIYIVIIIHEFGHVFFSKVFGLEINSVTLYPFGGLTKTNKLINFNLNKDLLIYFGGLLFQLLFFTLTNFVLPLKSNDISLFNQYNYFIFLFNLLPIIPLDGYLIFNNFLNRIISFYSCLKLSFIISVIVMTVFCFEYRNNFVIILYLIFNLINYLKNMRYIFNRFLLERFLENFYYSKICYFYDNNLKNIKRDKYSYFYQGENLISEKKYLAELFDISLKI